MTYIKILYIDTIKNYIKCDWYWRFFLWWRRNTSHRYFKLAVHKGIHSQTKLLPISSRMVKQVSLSCNTEITTSTCWLSVIWLPHQEICCIFKDKLEIVRRFYFVVRHSLVTSNALVLKHWLFIFSQFKKSSDWFSVLLRLW